MSKNNLFEIQINFLDNKVYKSKLAKIMVNQDEEDSWYPLEDFSLVAYKNILIKVIDQVKETSFFMFLANTNIIVENNKIIINSTNHINAYKHIDKKVNYKDDLKKVNEAIKYLETSQMIGLEIDDFIELEHLKQQRYLYKMQSVMNLIKSEVEHE